MKASQIRLRNLITFTDHLDAIRDIENDYRNVVGGIHAWNSGKQTYLTKSAENKIKAIEVRIDNKFDGDDS